jgi:hypothetical protein
MANKYYQTEKSIKLIKINVDTSQKKLLDVLEDIKLVHLNLNSLSGNFNNVVNSSKNSSNKDGFFQQISNIEKQLKLIAKTVKSINKTLQTTVKESENFKIKIAKTINPNLNKLVKDKVDTKTLPKDLKDVCKTIDLNLQNAISLESDMLKINKLLDLMSESIKRVQIPEILNKTGLAAEKLAKEMFNLNKLISECNSKNLDMEYFFLTIEGLTTQINEIKKLNFSEENLQPTNLDMNIKLDENVELKPQKITNFNCLQGFENFKNNNSNNLNVSVQSHNDNDINSNNSDSKDLDIVDLKFNEEENKTNKNNDNNNKLKKKDL